jgi:hypothetical protein
MGKTLTYSGFIISALLVVLAFITAKTYAQLAIAVLLYPLLAYFALKLLPRKGSGAPAITIKLPPSPMRKVEAATHEKVEVADVDKRTFLKLIGAAGISFFVFSLLGRRVESLLFDRTAGNAGTATLPTGSASGADSGQTLPAAGYRISEIDDGIVSYYGFTNQSGNWLIMREDTETSSFRYAKGDSGFSKNWANRENLKYDYYYNLF